MFLCRIFRKTISLLFPGYAEKKVRKEKAEVLSFGQRLLSEEKLRTVFPHLKIRRNEESGKWIILANDRIDPILLFTAFPNIGRAVTKYKSGRILTSVPINRENSLTLVEYLFPLRRKLGISEQEKVLFARTVIRRGCEAESVVDFYMDATAFSKACNR